MKHAVLGAGGVGGLIGALLANVGEDVTLILRSENLAAYPAQLKLDRPDSEVAAPIQVVNKLEAAVDVLWITVKAMQLEEALQRIAVPAQSISVVVPLLNGMDHVGRLRRLYGGERVVPATIAVEAERIAPGHIVQRSRFVRVSLATGGRPRLDGVVALLRQAGVDCQFVADEKTMLWGKLCFLAPFALATSAAGKTSGEIIADEHWSALLRSAVRESCAVAVAEGAAVDENKIMATIESLPPTMRSSMQKDVAAGRMPELDAIAGPILKGGLRHHIDVAACQKLVHTIQGGLTSA